ncbi:tyrosine-type recombinase/integrase [Yersinia enterocolitica]|uniref:tyrosine-type recombinase/integrase n=1 Tax=Yersinia enterocolitica TaxID=630 RepID=UPI0021ADE8A8|nr:tyrosine-type recombinase/integrase [Yersinia enterocolitica]
MSDYHHGVRIVEINDGTRVISTVSTAVVGMVCTGDDADTALFPLNKPVLITDLVAAAAKAGKKGTLAASLLAIADQARPVTIVVRVATGSNEAGTATNLIGGVDQSGRYTGMKALIGAEDNVFIITTVYATQKAAMRAARVRLGEWSLPNPLTNIREFDQPEREMAWLNDDQIDCLLAACDLHGNPELTLIVRLCLSTGARWNEIAKIKASQISPNKITFINTKGKKNRTVPLSEDMYQALAARKGKPFEPCYKQFYRVIRLAQIELPVGQMTHVLRHTFASHFMMAGGNIIVLQRILGHSDIRVTMRYSHFAPDHLEDAIHFNPLARFESGCKVAIADEIASNEE